MADSATRDTRQRLIDWMEEGMKWVEDGRALVGLLQELLDENEQLKAEAKAAERDPEPLRQETDRVQLGREEIVEVTLEGDVDIGSLTQMKLQDHLEAGETRLVLDMEGVTYIDSAGLGEVVRAMKRAREAGGDLRVCSLRGNVLRIFEITGLDKAIAMYPTREEAVASWRQAWPKRPTGPREAAATPGE